MPERLECLPWMKPLTTQVLDLWEKRTLPHSVCLHGCSGLGKGHQCQFLAGLLFCEQPRAQAPCGQCRQCTLFTNGEHPDYLSIGLTDKGGKIGIDQIRKISDFTLSTAYFSSMRIVVIEPLEQMTLAAANALLKLLEEPPPNVYFILASSQMSLLMPTIRSRLQFFSVSPPSDVDFTAWLVDYINTHELDLADELSQKLLNRSYQLAQQGPLHALDFLLRSTSNDIEVLPGVPGYKINRKKSDLLNEFDRFLEVMTQSTSAIRVHLKALLRNMSIEESLLFYELWIGEQLKHLNKSDYSSKEKTEASKIKILWEGFNHMQSTRESLIRSPQLNITYLHKVLLDQWMNVVKRLNSAARIEE